VKNEPRVSRLLASVLLVTGDLDLDTILQRITEAAVSLVDARYGALGVISADGELLSNFVHQGIDDATAHRIGHLPEGRGILGVLIDDPRPLRLTDLHDHPASYGFPPNHPPMGSFLGTPILVRGEAFGNLYLTEKIGADAFSQGDEDLVVGLAAVAGAAIENARLYDELQLRDAWRDAVLKLSTAALAATPADQLRDLIVELGTDLSDGSGGCLVGPDADGLWVLASRGDGPGVGFVANLDGPVWSTLTTGNPIRAEAGPLFGKASLWAPIMERGEVIAALGVGRDRPFTRGEEHQVASFAAQCSLLWTYERAQEQLHRLSLVEDRERIGRDLHDTVIQRLFATGLSLQATTRRVEDQPEVVARLEQAVDDIDATVKEIRSTIFSLQRSEAGATSVRSEVLDLVSELTPILPAPPRVGFDGALDTMVPSPVAEHLLHVVREALTNVAKHAQASEVGLRLSVDHQHVTLAISDDGTGIPPDPSGGRGLENLRRRAVDLSGTFRTSSRADGRGTVVTWRVPVG
jgi:signal transduction histidine kinase